MTSKIIVNNIQADTGISSVTFISKVNFSNGITGNLGGDNVGINTDRAIKTLDVRGEATFGVGITTGDLNWIKDTYQQVYTFSGITGGSTTVPADGCLLLANPNANPSNTRVAAIVFGNKVSGVSTNSNSGIKAVIESYTNTNISGTGIYPADTGGSLRFSTKPDGATLREQMRIDSNGRVTKPYQVYFYARPSGSVNHTSGNLPYSAVDYNIGNHYNSSTYVFTAPVAGVYCISFQFFSLAAAAGGADLIVNGVLTMRCGREASETYYEGYSNSINKYLNVNDTVSVQVYTGTTHLNTPYSHFSAYLLG